MATVCAPSCPVGLKDSNLWQSYLETSQKGVKKRARVSSRSVNQVFPIEHAAEAYDLMMSGKARFRVVLTTGH